MDSIRNRVPPTYIDCETIALDEILKQIETGERFKKIFSEQLKSARIRAGLSQKQLAEIMKVPPPTISRYERGLMEPTLSTARIIAEILSCSIDELAGYEAPHNNKVKALYWNDLLASNVSVMYDTDTDCFVIEMIEAYNNMFSEFKAGQKFIIHSLAFKAYEDLLILFIDKAVASKRSEAAFHYFMRMLEHFTEMAKQKKGTE